MIIEYIWIDNSSALRSKTRTLDIKKNNIFDKGELLDKLPEWSFDGKETGQSQSDVILKPVHVFIDPFREGDQNFLVLCECFDINGSPLDSNSRYRSRQIFNKITGAPFFELHQEYVLYNAQTHRLLGWPLSGYPDFQGKYFCGIGADKAFGREIVEEHYQKCISAKIKIVGMTQKALPGKWEFQIGECHGIGAGDHLWMARYILHRVCEKHNVIASFDSRPIKGDIGYEWNISSLHVNYSTFKMRSPNGLSEIYNAVNKLENKHDEHMLLYGLEEGGNVTIKIPAKVKKEKCGYLQDLRPTSNADPYIVTSKIAFTTQSLH